MYATCADGYMTQKLVCLSLTFQQEHHLKNFQMTLFAPYVR